MVTPKRMVSQVISVKSIATVFNLESLIFNWYILLKPTKRDPNVTTAMRRFIQAVVPLAMNCVMPWLTESEAPVFATYYRLSYVDLYSTPANYHHNCE